MDIKKVVFKNWKKVALVVVISSIYLGMSLLTTTYNPSNWFSNKYAAEFFVTRTGQIPSINVRKSGMFREGREVSNWINELGTEGVRGFVGTANIKIYNEEVNITKTKKVVTFVEPGSPYALERGHIKLYAPLKSGEYHIEAKTMEGDYVVDKRERDYTVR